MEFIFISGAVIVAIGFTLVGFADVLSILFQGRRLDAKPEDAPVSIGQRLVVLIWVILAFIVVAGTFLTSNNQYNWFVVFCLGIPLGFIFVAALPYSLSLFMSVMSDFG